VSDVIPRLEVCMRAALPFLGSGEIPMDDGLIEQGLDSVTAVDLLLEIEREFAVVFPDELICAETFASGSSLGRVIEQLQARGEA
jgi:acyl carrier protein